VQRGVKVATFEQHGNWTLVRLADDTGNANAPQGWVYSSFLKSTALADKEAVAAKHR
jgi:hypothetical protein